jgi:hypothetical protein
VELSFSRRLLYINYIPSHIQLYEASEREVPPGQDRWPFRRPRRVVCEETDPFLPKSEGRNVSVVNLRIPSWRAHGLGSWDGAASPKALSNSTSAAAAGSTADRAAAVASAVPSSSPAASFAAGLPARKGASPAAPPSPRAARSGESGLG